MPYKFQPNRMYRMPTHFGPATGPRQGENGRKFANLETPKMVQWSVSYLTRAEQLAELIPDGVGLELTGEPVVTVVASYVTELEWLAGRGYNTLGVSFPVAFNGKQDRAAGSFLTVLWENLCDPILTGREELGFSKIYCELPEPRIYQGEMHCIASWLGFKFMDMNVRNLRRVPAPEVTARGTPNDGTLHYKYVPKTGEWGKSDVAYVVITPASGDNAVVKEELRGEGTVAFHHARWEDMPTQFNIVNAIRDLTVVEYRGTTMVKTVGGKDVSDQRVLR